MPRDMSLESPSPLDREPPANLPARFVAKEAAVSEATKIYTDYHMMGPLSGYTQEQAEAAWAQVQSQHLGSNARPAPAVRPTPGVPHVDQNYVDRSRQILRGVWGGRALLDEWRGSDAQEFAFARQGGESFMEHFPNLTAELDEDAGNHPAMVRLFATVARSRDLCPTPYWTDDDSQIAAFAVRGAKRLEREHPEAFAIFDRVPDTALNRRELFMLAAQYERTMQLRNGETIND